MEGIRLKFLLASKRGGYWRLGDGVIQKWKGDHLERDFGPYPWTNTLPIVAACEDLDGNLVVGTYGDGVYWFDAEGKATRISKEEGLSHNSVLSVTVDREGCLWVGTNGGGLNRVRRKLFDVLERTRGSVVQSVCEDGKGGLWIGYTGNRVDHYTGSGTQRFRLIPGSLPVDVDPDTMLDVKSVFVGRKEGAYGGNWVLSGTWGALGPHLLSIRAGPVCAADRSKGRWTGRSRPSFRTGRAGCGSAPSTGCCGWMTCGSLRLATAFPPMMCEPLRTTARETSG